MRIRKKTMKNIRNFPKHRNNNPQKETKTYITLEKHKKKTA